MSLPSLINGISKSKEGNPEPPHSTSTTHSTHSHHCHVRFGRKKSLGYSASEGSKSDLHPYQMDCKDVLNNHREHTAE